MAYRSERRWRQASTEMKSKRRNQSRKSKKKKRRRRRENEIRRNEEIGENEMKAWQPKSIEISKNEKSKAKMAAKASKCGRK
jgi:hypothetical protein